jgi:hypothetical protein
MSAPGAVCAVPTASHGPTFSSAPATVVPLLAKRVSLPDSLTIVPLKSVLPPAIAHAYSESASVSLLRSPLEVFTMNSVSPLRPARIAGSRSEYVKLITRLHEAGMLSFTSTPKAVNGVFTVEKDTDSDRLIIDARAANRLFVNAPQVQLPNPSHLVSLQVPRHTQMYVGKTDLSNFYHHLGLEEWMQPYFALPPLTPSELEQCGVTDTHALYPMCITLPMGFSHAVYLAQTAHEHTLYSAGVLSPEDNLLRTVSPLVSHQHALHGILIDDFFFFSLNPTLAAALHHRVIAAYRAAGFVVKMSKVVQPTTSTVTVMGLDIHGAAATLGLSVGGRMDLIRATLSFLRSEVVSGTQLSHLIGRWTWTMLIRRPSLAILQHVYRYIQVAGVRRFTLWTSVRRELYMLLGVLPLLEAQLDAPFFHRVIATDASELAAGVVSTPLTATLHAQCWPLCSSRQHATLQALLHNEVSRPRLLASCPPRSEPRAALDTAREVFNDFYHSIDECHWSTIISKQWRCVEHINALELRAVILAMHWLLSYPSSLSTRVYCLVDSAVAFFSLWKGRSSSPLLLRILRKIGAMSLVSGVCMLPGWLPSECNPADAPSRLNSSAHRSISRSV